MKLFYAVFGAIVLTLIVLLAVEAFSADGKLLQLAPVGLRAVDGDTLRTRQERYRILGMDAPELYSYKCEAERILAERARDRLQQLISPPHKVTVRSPDGNAPFTRLRDRYGRKLVNVWSDGKLVDRIMIAEGLARSYTGGARQSWCK